VRRWFNGGNADGGLLSAQEQSLRSLYRRVLRLLNSEPAIYRGSFFDLMYVNFDNHRFSPHTNYAFLRHDKEGGTTLLIAVNFSDTPRTIDINVPELAFSLCGIKEGRRSATDLISGRRMTKDLCSTKPFTTDIAAWGAVVWKFKA